MVIITILLTTINIISDCIHMYSVDIIWTLPQSHIESYSIFNIFKYNKYILLEGNNEKVLHMGNYSLLY